MKYLILKNHLIWSLPERRTDIDNSGFNKEIKLNNPYWLMALYKPFVSLQINDPFWRLICQIFS